MSTALALPCFAEMSYYDKAVNTEQHLAWPALAEADRLLRLLVDENASLLIRNSAGVQTDFHSMGDDKVWVEIWHRDYSGTFTSAWNAARILERALVNFGGFSPKEDLSACHVEWLY